MSSNNDMLDFLNPLMQNNDGLIRKVTAYIGTQIAEMHEIAKTYESQYPKLCQAVSEHTTQEKWASAGKNTTYGYYTPSPIIDKLTSNMSKGKLLKDRPATGDYFAYSFDSQARLLQADRYANKRLSYRVLMVRDNPNVEYGLMFIGERQPTLMQGCKAIYDETGKIIEFFEVKMPLLIGGNLYTYEKYYYDDDGKLEGADTILQGIYPKMCVYERYMVLDEGKKTKLILTSNYRSSL